MSYQQWPNMTCTNCDDLDGMLLQGEVKVMSLPSKRQGLYTVSGSTIIARSDSNGEDLEAFAGAGKLQVIPL